VKFIYIVVDDTPDLTTGNTGTETPLWGFPLGTFYSVRRGYGM
jgi:hypothetical protein